MKEDKEVLFKFYKNNGTVQIGEIYLSPSGKIKFKGDFENSMNIFLETLAKEWEHRYKNLN